MFQCSSDWNGSYKIISLSLLITEHDTLDLGETRSSFMHIILRPIITFNFCISMQHSVQVQRHAADAVVYAVHSHLNAVTFVKGLLRQD